MFGLFLCYDLLGFYVQKWSKGKQKEKVNNMVLFDQATYDKLLSEAPKYKLITPSVLSDRLRVCSLCSTLLSFSFHSYQHLCFYGVSLHLE